jgi:hypothetical protein
VTNELSAFGRLAKIDGVSLVLPDGVPFTEWAEMGSTIAHLGRTTSWIAGDWLFYGERVHKETYVQASDVLGLSIPTMMNLVAVSKAYPPSERVPELTWSHHRVVAWFPTEERKGWLKRAVENKWSKDELRSAIAEAEGKPPAMPRPSKAEVESWKRAYDALQWCSGGEVTVCFEKQRVGISSGIEVDPEAFEWGETLERVIEDWSMKNG